MGHTVPHGRDHTLVALRLFFFRLMICLVKVHRTISSLICALLVEAKLDLEDMQVRALPNSRSIGLRMLQSTCMYVQ